LAHRCQNHAALLSKLVKAERPTIETDPDQDHEGDSSLMKRAHEINEAIIILYDKSIQEATEPHIKKVFEAILEVEKNHLDLASPNVK